MAKITTKEKILKTSFYLFLKKGFTDVSINDIVKKAGLSKGGFFHYFKNKEHLLKEIIQTFIIPNIEIVAKNIFDTHRAVPDKLKAYFDIIPNYGQLIQGFVKDKTIHPRCLYLLMMEALKKFPYFKNQYSKIFQRIYKLIKEQLSEGQKRGEIKKDLDLEVVSYEILINYEGALHLWIIQPDMNLTELNKKLVTNIWNSIKAQE